MAVRMTRSSGAKKVQRRMPLTLVFFSALFELINNYARSSKLRFASVRVLRSADTRTPAVLRAGTLRRLAAGGSAARLEDAPARGHVNP
jgi:hypothetical protein